MENKRFIFSLLWIRIILMILFQAVIFFILRNKENAIEISKSYWALYLTLTNAILLLLMIFYFKSKNSSFFSIFKNSTRYETFYFSKMLPVIVITAMLPNLLLAYLFYGDAQHGATLLLFDIPNSVLILNLTIFPILQGIVEIPFYFFMIKPLIEKKTSKKIIYLGLPIFFLGFQHAFMPFSLDFTYIMYRSLMFMPFAALIGIMLDKNPRLLPFFSVLHILMNASFMFMYFI